VAAPFAVRFRWQRGRIAIGEATGGGRNAAIDDNANDPQEQGGRSIKDSRDPLKGLVEKIATDPCVAFEPEVLERLVTLKKVSNSTTARLRQ
jgi:hypothetical protein